MKKTWNVTLDDSGYKIQYLGQKQLEDAKISINGKNAEYTPTHIKNVGMFAKLDIPGKDVVVKISPSGKEASLLVDGRNIDGSVSAPHSSDLSRSSNKTKKDTLQQRKIKSGFGIYLIFVGCTYLNLILLSFSVQLSLPFSAMVPQIPLYIGLQIFIEEGVLSSFIIGILIALILASVYLLLYFLAKKRIPPIMVIIVFIAIDTLVLFFFSLDDIGTSLIDFAFHVWVLFTMINLYRTRVAMDKAELQ